MQYDLFSKTKYRLLSLSSGSSGNCYYFGTSTHGILIDAGIGFRTIKKYLREYGIAIETIVGILVTHDHGDHIKTIGYLGSKMNIPIYATEAVHQGIERSRYVVEKLYGSQRIIEKETPFEIQNFRITAFDVPHDSIENVGYQIECEGNTIVLATDVGRVTDSIVSYAKTADHLIIEANYDMEMLQGGSYPAYLKSRITCGTGHLSNTICGDLIASVFTPKLKEVWLCHLSSDNNHPELAYKTVEQILQQSGIVAGKDLILKTLSRGKPSGLREFTPTSGL